MQSVVYITNGGLELTRSVS